MSGPGKPPIIELNERREGLRSGFGR